MGNLVIVICLIALVSIVGVFIWKNLFTNEPRVLGELRLVTDETDGESYVAIAAPRSALDTLHDGEFVTLQVKVLRQ